MASPVGGWAVTASATSSGTATATKAAVSGKQHIVYGLSAATDSVVVGCPVVLSDSSATRWKTYLPATLGGALEKTFTQGLSFQTGRKVSAVVGPTSSSSSFKIVVSVDGITRGG